MSGANTNPSEEDVSLLLLRLRRYLPYLGIYASDVRTAVETIETLQRNNARLVELAKTATRDAVAEAHRLIERERHQEDRNIATEAMWKERQGDEYGSY